MSHKLLVSTLVFLAYTLNLSAQHWIPRLNKNGTYSLVTEAGKLVNNQQYDNLTPLWKGARNAFWQSEGKAGCIFPNKVSITFELSKHIGMSQMLKPMLSQDKNGTSVLEDYVYLLYFSKNGLLVNIKTGKYIEDEPNSFARQALRLMPFFPVRNGIMKIHRNGNYVDFVDLNFNSILPGPIKNGEMVHPDLFIVQDSISKKYGLMDAKGKIKTPYSYESMQLTPNKNHILVGITLPQSSRKRFGLLDAQGKLVLDTIYSEIRAFAADFYVVRTEDKSGVLNQFLEPVVPLERQQIERTNDFYTEQEKYLFVLNNYGKPYSEYNFLVLDSTGNFAFKGNGNGLNIQQECKCFTLNKHGGEKLVYSIKDGIQFAFRDTFERIYCLDGFGDSVFVKCKKAEVQLISRNGNILGTYPYDVILPLKSMDGYYKVLKEDKYGIIDASGEVIAPLKYDNIFDAHAKGREEKLTGFKTGTRSQFGIYDKTLKQWKLFNTEKEAIETLYPIYPEFKIVAKKKDQYGVVRRNGKQVIPAQYLIIRQLGDSPVFACYDQNIQKWSILDENNHAIFTFDEIGDQNQPKAYLLKPSGNYAIQHGSGTLFLEKGTYKQLSYFNLLYIESLCMGSYENNGWVTLFKPPIDFSNPKQIWVNYFTGKVYMEE